MLGPVVVHEVVESWRKNERQAEAQAQMMMQFAPSLQLLGASTVSSPAEMKEAVDSSTKPNSGTASARKPRAGQRHSQPPACVAVVRRLHRKHLPAMLDQYPDGCRFVHLEWVYQCCAMGTLVDTKPFELVRGAHGRLVHPGLGGVGGLARSSLSMQAVGSASMSASASVSSPPHSSQAAAAGQKRSRQAGLGHTSHDGGKSSKKRRTGANAGSSPAYDTGELVVSGAGPSVEEQSRIAAMNSSRSVPPAWAQGRAWQPRFARGCVAFAAPLGGKEPLHGFVSPPGSSPVVDTVLRRFGLEAFHPGPTGVVQPRQLQAPASAGAGTAASASMSTAG